MFILAFDRYIECFDKERMREKKNGNEDMLHVIQENTNKEKLILKQLFSYSKRKKSLMIYLTKIAINFFILKI